MSRELAALVTLGKRAFAEKDLNKAEKLLREAIGGGANFADLHYTLGLIYNNWGKDNQAVEHFQKSLEVNPGYTEALLSLSITLNDMGRYDEARAAYARANATAERAATDAPSGNLFRGKIANLHAELGGLYLALGHHGEAIEEYRKALRMAPRFKDLHLKLVVALRESGQIAEGLEEAERLVAEDPDSVPALAQLGVLRYLGNEKAKARRAWEEALYREPGNRLIQLYLNALERDKQMQEG